jgi:hypothetical protein
MSNPEVSNLGTIPIRKVNQRMAQRMARRAHIDEQGVAVP